MNLNQAPQVQFTDITMNEGYARPVIDDYDKKMLSYISRLYNATSGKMMDLDEVKSAIDALTIFNESQKMNYMDYLLHPEKSKGCKIPSTIPVPSAAFQMHNSVTLKTNSLGNVMCMFNPFFLYDNTTSMTKIIDGQEIRASKFTSFWYSNSETLDGRSAVPGLSPMDIGQGIPSVYGSYRVVSASIIVKYIGRMDIASGVIGGAIVFDDNPQIGSIGQAYNPEAVPPLIPYSTVGQGFGKYGNFDLAMDSFYHQENLALEGMRMIYFPIDNSFDEYMPIYKFADMSVSGDPLIPTLVLDKDNYKAGFNFMFYSLGAPPSSACFKIDIYVNYECLPDARFLNYMPISPPSPAISNYEKAEAVRIAQTRPVTSIKNEFTPTPSGGFFEKFKKKFGKVVPSIQTLTNSGLLDSTPLLKTGLTIAGNLLNQSAAPPAQSTSMSGYFGQNNQ